MKKKLCVLLTLLCLTGCGGQRTETPAQMGAYTFEDDMGRTVTLDAPKRVAALTGSFADIWCLAGGTDSLVAAAGDSWTSFDLPLSKDVTNLGAIKTPDLEHLLAAAPDLVLLSSNTAAQLALVEPLEQAGLTVACFNVTHFAEYLRMLEICTDLTGDTAAYERHGLSLREQIENARARADGSTPTVLYIRATGSSCKVKNSRDTVLGEMLADLGCINIADSEESLLEQLSLEQIIRSDPDYLFAVLQGADSSAAKQTLETTLLSNPAWQSLTAVREGRFHVLKHRL